MLRAGVCTNCAEKIAALVALLGPNAAYVALTVDIGQLGLGAPPG